LKSDYEANILEERSKAIAIAIH